MHNKKNNDEKKINDSKQEKDDLAKKALGESAQKISELTSDLKRLQAEFENYQKRTEIQNNEYKKFANASLLEDLLPVLDSLELGLKHNKEFVQIHEQLISIMRKKGLEKIDVNVGDDFNHDTMECLMQEKNEKLKEGQVVQVLSSGYKLNGKILRTTKISINKLDRKINCENNKNKVNDDLKNNNEKKGENCL